MAGELLRREAASPHSPLHGRDVDELLAEVEPRRGPERLLDLLLRAGPYDLTLADLEAAPHGIDLGPLEPRLPERRCARRAGRIELAPGPIVADVARLRAALARRADDGGLLLVGRRQLRSNNSWMHNLELLVSGPARCTLHVHPDDAARLGLRRRRARAGARAARARWRRPSRSRTPSCRASSRSRTAGGTTRRARGSASPGPTPA